MTLERTSGGWFRHPAAIVESSQIGERTRVWAFAHVLPGARVGADCNICDHVFVENEVIVGDRVTVKCGVQLWDGVTIEDDVFIGPNATFTNDIFPRSRIQQKRPTPTVLRRGASIGANATVVCGVTIGANAMVGSGAVVTHNVPANAIVVGNPAFIHGYVAVEKGVQAPETALPVEPFQTLAVGGVTMYRLPEFADLRGGLVVGEIGKQLPFEPKRFFVVHAVPTRQARGEHAHRNIHQFIVCLHGECSVVIDDGFARQEIRLSELCVGVHVPPMVWAVQYKFSPDALVLVLASGIYDAAEYVRDYDEFIALATDSRVRGMENTDSAR
ncbi:MAG: WxcM-like domain-containing protein [Acidobacteriota bacterium]